MSAIREINVLLVKDGEVDKNGDTPYTMYWMDSTTGLRGQCFRSNIDDRKAKYIAEGKKVVTTEAPVLVYPYGDVKTGDLTRVGFRLITGKEL